jgi:membrane fusion protein, copper/silver efflux system
MYANITIDAGYSQEVLAIPKEAVIQLGETNRVVLALGEGRFKSVTVTIGQQYKDLIAVTQGLTEGEKVVTSAQFLLDSESNLRAGLSRLGFEDMSDQPKHNSKVDKKTHQSSDSNMDMSEMHHSHAGH